jgi:nucleobase:cation symporter-1, NCS1 family
VSESNPATLESHSIDFIPHTERYGTPRSLFTLWFSSNLTILGVSVGTLGVAAGLSLPWTVAAIVLGNALGTFFMAAHSAQGPHLGIPQMIQSRAQFGVVGAAFPLCAVVMTYLLYCTANDLLIPGSIVSIAPVSGSAAMAIFSIATLGVGFAGYRLIHLLGAAMSWVSAGIFAVAFVLLLVRPASVAPAALMQPRGFSGVVFAMVVTQTAAWGLSYGPYVADYSRYLPARVPAATTFWYTAAGCFGGATLIMVFGAFLAAMVPHLPDDLGGTVAGLFGRWSALVRVAIILGVIEGNVMNLYSAYMAIVTIFSGLRERPHVGASMKLGVMLALSVAAFFMARAAEGHFQQFLADMLNLMIYLITPWSAINLADYYLVRKGNYRTEDMYRVDGIYGRFRWKTIAIYFAGVAAQAPFAQTSVYTGVIAARLGVDVAWIVGLIVPAVLYVAGSVSERGTRPALT